MKCLTNLTQKLAGEPGFEPSLRGPEPCALPLDDSPKTDVTQSKSGRFSQVVNDILPSILPQNADSCPRYPTGAHLITDQVRPFCASPHLNGVGGDTYEC